MTRLIVLIQLILILLVGCMPQGPSTARRDATGESVTAAPTATPTFSATEQLYWHSTTKVAGTITVNSNTKSVIYIRGQTIHDFLNLDSNYKKSFCLVTSFNTTSAKKQLRVRAVPFEINNYTTKAKERLLRIDLPATIENSSVCSGNVNLVNGATDAAYSPATICPTCISKFTSTGLSLYVQDSNTADTNAEAGITDADFVSTLQFLTLAVRIDPQGASTSETSTCTNASCQSSGYDCCLEGQCVINGVAKPNASSDPNYTQATTEVAANPAAILNWPNIYYVCQGVPLPTPTPTPTINEPTEGDARLVDLIKDYNCLLNGPNSIFTDCDSNSAAGYDSTRIRVWGMCGCNYSPLSSAQIDEACPDFGLQAFTDTGVYTDTGTIIRVACLTPQPNPEPTPFQDTQIGVVGRTIPHLFYSTAGYLYEDLNEIALSTILQEGTAFDPFAGPSDTTNQYNMNAILGNISLFMDEAYPAKVIHLTYGTSYIIQTKEGYYTPCFTCTRDSWFDAFSAQPATNALTGLTALGFTTERDNYSNNTTNGNYEDTIFGRACWVPPTMIPFSHSSNSDLKLQRQNRLTTQAAYYMNGYRRDWYGFNKGALIGSFDGVSWFAVGAGRRVTATSERLLLAINGAFGDIADMGSIAVSIVEDHGLESAADYDFDPTLTASDARYNKGASCQAYHHCTKDYDCISKLGWEYMCADVADYRTYVPKFDVEGNEIENSEKSVSFADVIYGNLPPATNGTKRCVYRGAGSPCKKDYTTLTSVKNRKLFMCAPNFYCADADSTSDFNSEIVRELELIDNYLFGQEADFFGRPKNYVLASSALPAVGVTNLEHNATLISAAAANDFGICRPGRSAASSTQVTQHSSRSGDRSTDYINQIGTCTSTYTALTRVQACPILDENEKIGTATNTNFGNYIANSASTMVTASIQNMCGQESKKSDGISIFNIIEGKIIGSTQLAIAAPMIVQNGCLRRAGSICHTDLDCGPNKLHAEVAGTYGTTQFGNIAEKSYWEEALICAQAKEKPSLLSDDVDNYRAYDMSLNRCCRPIGETLTMYTQVSHQYLAPDYDSSAVGSANLDIDTFSYLTPAPGNHYSRYSILSTLTNTVSYTSTPYTAAPVISANTTPTQFQWKTFSDTGKKSCCGGGFIRTFADGTHDWRVAREKLSIDPGIFKCLNYSQTTAFIDDGTAMESYAFLNKGNFNQNTLCTFHKNRGCVQNEFPLGADSYKIVLPKSLTAANYPSALETYNGVEVATMLLRPSVDTQQYEVNEFAPYINYNDPNMLVKVDDIYNTPAVIDDTNVAPTELAFQTENPRVSFFIPSFININTTNYNNLVLDTNGYINVSFVDGSASAAISLNIDLVYNATNCDTNDLTQPPWSGTIPGTSLKGWWCLEEVNYNGSTRTVMHMAVDINDLSTGAGDPCENGCKGGAHIRFKPFNTKDHFYKDILATSTARMGTIPGNDNYYLTKLGRLELLGIPQIFYEPLTCNYDKRYTVGGIYNITPTAADPLDKNVLWSSVDDYLFDYIPTFNSSTNRYLHTIYDTANTVTDTYGSDLGVNREISFIKASNSSDTGKVKFNPIFSGEEFLCCTKLGDQTTQMGNCCSGYGIQDESPNGAGQTTYTCKLPTTTNLNVYFNRFVSNEGIGDTLPGGGLKETDFIPETGEPKLNVEVHQKLTALGQEYCETGNIRHGGAFGSYIPQPFSVISTLPGGEVDEDGRYYSILDSVTDIGENLFGEEAGYQSFIFGYRWNHHLYCDQ